MTISTILFELPWGFFQKAVYLLSLILLGMIGCGAKKIAPPELDNSKPAFKFYFQALSEIEQGEFDLALAHLDSAIHHQPSYVQFYFVKGQVLEFQGQVDSSIVAYEKCLKLKSYYPEVYRRLGKLYLKKENYQQAATYLSRSIPEFPDSSQMRIQLGMAYYQIGKYFMAMDQFREYVKQNPQPEPEYWKWYGLTLAGLKDYEKAIEALEHYRRLNSRDYLTLKTLGIIYITTGNEDRGISLLNQALQLNPTDVEIYLYRSRYFQKKGKLEDARKQLYIGLQQDSLNADLLMELARMDYQVGKLSESENTLERIIQHHPDYWLAYRYLGLIAEANENYQKAFTCFQTYLSNTYQSDPEIQKKIEQIRPKLNNK